VEITARRADTDETTTKTITVTVTDLDDEAPTNIQINDAAADINGFVVGSKPNKHGSVVFRRRNISRGNTKYPIMYGYSEGFYIRLEVVPPGVLPSGFDINTISVTPY
jgi:hypothetical protein